jgi:hypothetical protein
MKNPRIIEISSGRRTSLQAGTTSIGTAAGSTVVVADPLVSPTHARIEVLADRVVLHRLGLNPIFVGGREIDYETPLSPGAEIAFSPHTHFRFEADRPGVGLLDRLLNRKPVEPAGDGAAAAARDEQPAVLGILSVRQAVIVGALYVAMGAVAYFVYFLEPSGERFMPTMESFDVDYKQEMSRPECLAALKSASRSAQIAPADALRDLVSKALVAEGRGSWVEARRYYDAALNLLSSPQCRPARFIAVRRDAVNAAATKMVTSP